MLAAGALWVSVTPHFPGNYDMTTITHGDLKHHLMAGDIPHGLAVKVQRARNLQATAGRDLRRAQEHVRDAAIGLYQYAESAKAAERELQRYLQSGRSLETQDAEGAKAAEGSTGNTPDLMGCESARAAIGPHPSVPYTATEASMSMPLGAGVSRAARKFVQDTAKKLPDEAWARRAAAAYQSAENYLPLLGECDANPWLKPGESVTFSVVVCGRHCGLTVKRSDFPLPCKHTLSIEAVA